MTWVYELEDPHFYNMLVTEWHITSAWTSLTWQQYKGELLRVRGLNVMSIAEYQSAFQMGVFPFYHRTFNGLCRIICIEFYHLHRCGIPLPLGSGINIQVGKKNPLKRYFGLFD
jgi:hypothetical protein